MAVPLVGEGVKADRNARESNTGLWHTGTRSPLDFAGCLSQAATNVCRMCGQTTSNHDQAGPGCVVSRRGAHSAMSDAGWPRRPATAL